ncbi:hypothetical protein NP493_4678g00001 [Ridgeia piscesae]|uniref:Uncharacterized protein n=1 Tax=Ridgeia piscesae TaxID=27915 RepID=A0AAD9IZL6_RIDPI|nr:hypothetical protein NP493_4678g00001 [Ridgeia piscesae]
MAADGETSESDKLSVVLRAGASIVGSKPIISHDTKYLLCVSGNAVKVLSTVSGECVQELRHHTACVTSIQINPANQYQLFSCSLDKTLIKWDFTDGVVLKVYQLYRPLVAIYVTAASDTTLLVKRKVAAKGLTKATFEHRFRVK